MSSLPRDDSWSSTPAFAPCDPATPPPSRTAAIREPTPPTMPRKQSKSSGDSVAAARPSRRCCAVASECTPKLCVACKLGGLKDVFACRETLGHVAPNWDAPDAGAFFADGAVTAAEAKALADASSVVPDRSAPKKRKDPNAPKKGKSAYLFYKDANTAAAKEANEGKTSKELTELLKQQWDGLGEEEKKPYEDELMKCADAFVRRPPPNTLLAHAQPPPGRPEPSLSSFLAAPCIL